MRRNKERKKNNQGIRRVRKRNEERKGGKRTIKE